MVKAKRLILAISVLLVLFLAGCTPRSGSDLFSLINIGGISLESYDLEYCKYLVRTSNLDLKAAEREVEKKQRDISTYEDKLRQAQLTGSQSDIEEKKSDLNRVQMSLQESKKFVSLARQSLQENIRKCDALKIAPDAYICNEFIKNIDLELTESYRELQGNQKDLEDVQRLLDQSLMDKEDKEVISSIEKELQEENFEILKVKNKIDNGIRMKKELEEICPPS